MHIERRIIPESVFIHAVLSEDITLPTSVPYRTREVYVADPGDEREEWTEWRMLHRVESEYPSYAATDVRRVGLGAVVMRYDPFKVITITEERALIRYWVEEDGRHAEMVKTEQRVSRV